MTASSDSRSAGFFTNTWHWAPVRVALHSFHSFQCIPLHPADGHNDHMTHYHVNGWLFNRGLTEEIRSASASLMGVPGGSTSGCLQMESNTSDVLAPLKGSCPKIHW